jgi:DNA-binding response OmpR family regulator
MNPIRVLVVDDDREIAKGIEKFLLLEGYEVATAHDGLAALEIVMTSAVHLMLLDVMMPKLDGLSTLMKIRETKNIPIIMVSAKTEDSDKILGLSMGADDYVSKPFNAQELLARVRSQLRRYIELGNLGDKQTSSQLIVGGLCLDTETFQFTVDGEPVKLTSKEFKILELLMSNPGIVFSAEKIYERVWNDIAYSVENTVMVHVRRIREKIEINPKEPKYLKVVWGIGYKMEKYK